MGDTLSIIGGRVIGEGGIIPDGRVDIEGGIITAVGAGKPGNKKGDAVIDAQGAYVSPGFIDCHLHGGGGADFLHADPAKMRRIIATHVRYGTTGICATVGTASPETMKEAVAGVAEAISRNNCPGLVGINIEGPFLNPVKCGAHPEEEIRLPNSDELNEFVKNGRGQIKIMTLAPEMEGGMELIDSLCERGIVAALGHSAATLDEAREAFRHGAFYITHIFNAMSGLHHREPGLALAALHEKAVVELIVDGVHLHPAMVRLALTVKDFDKVVLISDCVGRLDDGSRLEYGGPVTRSDGVLCGTTLTMARAVANSIRFTGISLPEAVMMGTINPARVLGVDQRKGSLVPGKDADIVVFDDDFEVRCTIVGGRVEWMEE